MKIGIILFLGQLELLSKEGKDLNYSSKRKETTPSTFIFCSSYAKEKSTHKLKYHGTESHIIEQINL